ncbi:MAG: hypothetical protein V1676_00325 [Candidatus Diapherotrites archaeon]
MVKMDPSVSRFIFGTICWLPLGFCVALARWGRMEEAYALAKYSAVFLAGASIAGWLG